MPLKKGWLSALGTTALVKTPDAIIEALGKQDSRFGGLLSGAVSDEFIKPASYAGGVIGSPLGLLPVLSLIFGAGQGQIITMQALRAFKPTRLPVDTVIKLLMRDYPDKDTKKIWLEELYDIGLTDERINATVEAFRPLLGVGEIKDLYLRGELGKPNVANEAALKKLGDIGFSKDNAEQLIKLFFYIPPVPDLIRMVVREAWRDDIAEQYGTDESYDKLPFDTFAKAGVTPDWLKRYWRAHWELPSIQLAFEMLHRGEITEADIDQLLFTQDIMPFWRKPIKEIAYRVITRVDLRRLYRDNLIDEDRLLVGYKNLGYNPDDAVLMSNWTKVAYPQSDATEQDKSRDLTRSQIEKAYILGLVNRQEIIGLLIELDYDTDTAEFIVDLIDTKQETERIEQEIKTLAVQYTNNIISKAEFIAGLGELNLPGELLEYLISKYDKTKATRTKRPSKEDFMRWYHLELIDKATLREELAVTGYGDAYIENYIKESAI